MGFSSLTDETIKGGSVAVGGRLHKPQINRPRQCNSIASSKHCRKREHGGVVVERWTLNLEVLGSIPTDPQASPCCVLEQDILAPYSTG